MLFRSAILFLLLVYAVPGKAYALPYANPYHGDKIAFGTSGGFAGITQEYVLYSSGELYSRSLSGKEVFIKKISTAQRKKIFAKARKIYTAQLSFNQPGNMTEFVELSRSQKTSKKYSWGEAGAMPPEDVKELFNLLISLTNNK